MARPLTFREAFLARAARYEELVMTGQHTPPPHLAYVVDLIKARRAAQGSASSTQSTAPQPPASS